MALLTGRDTPAERRRTLEGLRTGAIDMAVRDRRLVRTLQFDPVVVRLLAEHEPFQRFMARLYQVLLGQQEGPRFGGFVALYGIPETIALIDTALARQADAA